MSLLLASGLDSVALFSTGRTSSAATSVSGIGEALAMAASKATAMMENFIVIVERDALEEGLDRDGRM